MTEDKVLADVGPSDWVAGRGRAVDGEYWLKHHVHKRRE